MKFLLLQLALLLFTCIAGAQNVKKIDNISNAFYYDYFYLNEQGNRATETNQQMVLEVGESFSKFQSLNKAFADSLIALYANEPPSVVLSKVMPQISSSPVPILLNYVVIKEYAAVNKATFIGKTLDSSSLFKVEETIEFDWQIEPTRDTSILDIQCIMATTRYAGRDYIAWFSPDIPINDGPYKFSGLPGLIIKLHDTLNEHVFTFNGVAKPRQKPMYLTTQKTSSTNSKGFARAFEASKSDFLDELDNGTFSSEEMKVRAIGRVINLNNLIEQF